VEILKRLDHPNILKIYEFYQDTKYFYIVSEMCTGGELFDRIQEEGHFSERKAAMIMRQILSAVFYCHQHKIVHRDLKPENLLYESDKKNANVKVIDFGTSRHIDGEE
jgi:calcium-dependent protein kinase